jgi:hypothetical protein
VIVDEVGYAPIDREECNIFSRFIGNPNARASTIITSNKAFFDWPELFHDPVIVTPVLDRLLHHSAVINIRGNSYRLRGKTTDEALEGGKIQGRVVQFSRPKMVTFKRPLTTSEPMKIQPEPRGDAAWDELM